MLRTPEEEEEIRKEIERWKKDDKFGLAYLKKLHETNS
jgi:hypothetical protein